jgi:hypothetical protein
MLLRITMAAVTVALGAYSVYTLASAGARVGVALVAIFAIGGLFQWLNLRARGSASAADHVLAWAMASQLGFSVMASSISDQASMLEADCTAQPEGGVPLGDRS